MRACAAYHVTRARLSWTNAIMWDGCTLGVSHRKYDLQSFTCSYVFLVCQDGSISVDQCGQKCGCVGGQYVNCTRIRKEFTSMTIAERKRYIQTIKTASTDPRFKPDYDTLINDHRILFFSGIHDRIHFLTWHRYFILLYENLLRRVDCNFTVAYWDWSLASSNPWITANERDLWHGGDAGFGGNGVEPTRCVQTGPFGESVWRLVPLPSGTPPESRCLKRQFNGRPPDAMAVATVLNTVVFIEFELMLRLNLHDVVHCLIAGTMCSLDSAAAPEFFLHHGFVDKLWDDWQKRSDAQKNAFFPTIDERMPGTQVYPRQVIDLLKQPGGVRAEYQPTQKAASVMPLLRSKYRHPRFTIVIIVSRTCQEIHEMPSHPLPPIIISPAPSRWSTTCENAISKFFLQRNKLYILPLA